MDHSHWIYEIGRIHTTYLIGVQSFLKIAEDDRVINGKESILCPCMQCKNFKGFKDTKNIQYHLRRHCFMYNYTCWSRHGESLGSSITESHTVVDNDEEKNDPYTINDNDNFNQIMKADSSGQSNIAQPQIVAVIHKYVASSREPIEITLWEKIAFTYANLLAHVKVIAVSSLKVTNYLGTLQLESTSATIIVIDLAIEGYNKEIKCLKTLSARPSSHYGYQTEDDIRNNQTTIAYILSRNPQAINNHRFSCIARVKEIFANRKWFSRKCTVCNDNMHREGLGMVCKNCIVPQEEIITYCVNGTICDNTGTMPIVFFKDAMTQVPMVDCRKLVINEGYNDPTVLPPQLVELIGQKKMFHFIFKSTETSSIQQTLEVHFTTQPDRETEIIHDENAVSEITSSLTTPQTPAPKASRRHDIQESGT
ncbi:hypothetical protein SSX86_030008 [Deinandra increscens subsp. villosa]|uniref:Transposase-associated domain-containing protein n=1 Tax=Deinandra increscens subsp. villosa TaxID=3103831 RepID=A0AAP0CG43_9ASTR